MEDSYLKLWEGHETINKGNRGRFYWPAAFLETGNGKQGGPPAVHRIVDSQETILWIDCQDYPISKRRDGASIKRFLENISQSQWIEPQGRNQKLFQGSWLSLRSSKPFDDRHSKRQQLASKEIRLFNYTQTWWVHVQREVFWLQLLNRR